LFLPNLIRMSLQNCRLTCYWQNGSLVKLSVDSFSKSKLMDIDLYHYHLPFALPCWFIALICTQWIMPQLCLLSCWHFTST
jgi:hypothetical protein